MRLSLAQLMKKLQAIALMEDINSDTEVAGFDDDDEGWLYFKDVIFDEERNRLLLVFNDSGWFHADD